MAEPVQWSPSFRSNIKVMTIGLHSPLQPSGHEQRSKRSKRSSTNDTSWTTPCPSMRHEGQVQTADRRGVLPAVDWDLAAAASYRTSPTQPDTGTARGRPRARARWRPSRLMAGSDLRRNGQPCNVYIYLFISAGSGERTTAHDDDALAVGGRPKWEWLRPQACLGILLRAFRTAGAVDSPIGLMSLAEGSSSIWGPAQSSTPSWVPPPWVPT